MNPEVRWLEDEVIPEWEELTTDRWTNVPDGTSRRLLFKTLDLDRVYFYTPPAQPQFLRVLSSNWTQIARYKPTRRERVLRWWFRLRLALAEWISPYDDRDDDGGVW